jgi:hypothetical protein
MSHCVTTLARTASHSGTALRPATGRGSRAFQCASAPSRHARDTEINALLRRVLLLPSKWLNADPHCLSRPGLGQLPPLLQRRRACAAHAATSHKTIALEWERVAPSFWTAVDRCMTDDPLDFPSYSQVYRQRYPHAGGRLRGGRNKRRLAHQVSVMRAATLARQAPITRSHWCR